MTKFRTPLVIIVIEMSIVGIASGVTVAKLGVEPSWLWIALTVILGALAYSMRDKLLQNRIEAEVERRLQDV